MGTSQLHFYDQSDDGESGTPSMCFHYNVNGQYSVIIVALCAILHQKKSTVCCCVTCKLFPASEVLIISITIMLFGRVFVAFGFFAVSHYQSVKAAGADVFLRTPHEAGKLRLLLIRREHRTALFYDLITTDVNFRKVTK